MGVLRCRRSPHPAASVPPCQRSGGSARRRRRFSAGGWLQSWRLPDGATVGGGAGDSAAGCGGASLQVSGGGRRAADGAVRRGLLARIKRLRCWPGIQRRRRGFRVAVSESRLPCPVFRRPGAHTPGEATMLPGDAAPLSARRGGGRGGERGVWRRDMMGVWEGGYGRGGMRGRSAEAKRCRRRRHLDRGPRRPSTRTPRRHCMLQWRSRCRCCCCRRRRLRYAEFAAGPTTSGLIPAPARRGARSQPMNP